MKGLFALLIALMAFNSTYGQRVESIQTIDGSSDPGIDSSATVVRIIGTPAGGYLQLPTSETSGRSLTLLNLTGNTLLLNQIIVRDTGLTNYWDKMAASPDLLSPTTGPMVIKIMYYNSSWREIK